MSFNFIQKYIPSNDTIINHKHLKFLHRYFDNNNLWRINRRTTPKAFAVGIFCAFLPMPFQMVAAAILAIPFRANLPISVALVWLTNPITMPPVFYFCYKVGLNITGLPGINTNQTIDMEWLTNEFTNIFIPLITGSVFCGIIAAVVSYYGSRHFWRYSIAKKWRSRKVSNTE